MLNHQFDRLTVDLKRSRLRLADDLVFVPQPYGNECFYHVQSPSSGKFFRIGYAEYVFVSLLDGDTSFVQALAMASQQLGVDALSENHAMQVYSWLLDNQLAAFVDREIRHATSETKPTLMQRLNPFSMKWSFGCPDRVVETLLPWCGWIFHPAALICWGLLIAVALITAVANSDRLAVSSQAIFAPQNWLWMLVTWVVLKAIHELGHGIACKKYGGSVRDAGVLFVLFAPLAYVDVTSTWSFTSKWRRILVAAAGMIVELSIAAMATILWANTSSEMTAHLLYNVMVMASVSTVLFNANPLMRFDGYYILSDLLEIPNLYVEGGRAFGQQMQRLFYGSAPQSQISFGGFRRILIPAYGYAAAAWRIVICLSLGMAATVMFKGAGIVLAAFGVLGWFGQPTKRIVVDLLHRYHERRHTVVRAMVVTFVCLVAGWIGWIKLPSPATISIPGVLDYEAASVVRSHTSGFVAEVIADNGDYVQAGDPILRLVNDELDDEVTELHESMEQSRVRERMARQQHDTVTVQLELREQGKIATRLNQKQQSYDGLVVRAPAAGRVVARRMGELIGTYVEEGGELFTIGNEANKEVVLSVSEGDLDQVIPQVGEQVTIRVGSRRRIVGSLRRVEPRATKTLVHESLAATNGGPLPVKAASSDDARQPNEEVELLRPRFRAVVALPKDVAIDLFSGERAYANFGPRQERLGEWLFAMVENWIQAKLDQS